MRIFKLISILAGMGLFIFGCAGNKTTSQVNNASPNAVSQNTNGPPVAPVQDPLAESRTMFKNVCARCHMENGEGGRVDIDGNTIKVPSFKQPRLMKDEDEEFIEQISEGSDEMPAFKSRLSPEQIKDMVKFIRKEFQGK